MKWALFLGVCGSLPNVCNADDTLRYANDLITSGFVLQAAAATEGDQFSQWHFIFAKGSEIYSCELYPPLGLPEFMGTDPWRQFDTSPCQPFLVQVDRVGSD